MKDKDSNIEDLYSKVFEDFEEAGIDDDQEFMAIQHKVNQQSFYIYNLRRFNIYYASLIVTGFLLTTITFIDHFFLHKTQANTITNNNVLKTDSINRSIDENDFGTSTGQGMALKSKKVNNYNHNGNISISSIEQLQVQKDSLLTSSVDSLKSLKNSIDTVIVRATPPKKKKVFYVYKRDTLVLYDTVAVKKNK